MSEAPSQPTRNLRRMVVEQAEPLACEFRGRTAEKRIMLVVPGRLFRNGIEHVLQGSERVVIGDCETLDQVEAALEALPTPDLVPDLFVVGIAAPGDPTEEFARIRALRAKMPASRWIVLSRSADIDFLCEAIESGIEGMLLEDAPGEALQLVAELVMLGHSFIPVGLARVLAARAVGAPRAALSGDAPTAVVVPLNPRWNNAIKVPESAIVPASDPSRRWQVSLSDRENEILHCLVAGHPNKLIARELRIAEATVKVHVKALLRKMQVTNRTQAAISALQFLRTTEGGSRPARVLEVEPPCSDEDGNMLSGNKTMAMLRAADKVSFRYPPAE